MGGGLAGDDLRLVEANDRLGEGIVVGVANPAYQRLGGLPGRRPEARPRGGLSLHFQRDIASRHEAERAWRRPAL